MFITLLTVTFAIAVIVSMIVVRMFANPIDTILNRIISDDISKAWVKYLKFAIYVVGISSGVRIRALEKYINPSKLIENDEALTLTMDRWVLEVYRTIVETLQGIAWSLLVFFLVALLAYVIVRIFDSAKLKKAQV